VSKNVFDDKGMEGLEHRAKCLVLAATAVEKGFPGFWGSVRFNLQDGKVVNVNIEESVKLPANGG
jgi:hypothetical protein